MVLCCPSKIVLDPLLQQQWQSQNIFAKIFNLTGIIYRAEKNRKTLRFELGNNAYFVKLHQGVGWREIGKNLLQGKLPVLGAMQEWRAIQRLNELQIATMRLMGYGWRGFNPANLQSFVITEELAGMVSLEDFCRDWAKQPPPLAIKRALIAKVAHIAKVLHNNGVNHRDFYICHFLLDKKLQLYLIDLHRVQLRKKTPRRWVIKDIAGLYFSTFGIGLTKRDELRFIKHYTEQSLSQVLNVNKHFWEEVIERAEKLYIKETAKNNHKKCC